MQRAAGKIITKIRDLIISGPEKLLVFLPNCTVIDLFGVEEA
jgi:hypothetical protein